MARGKWWEPNLPKRKRNIEDIKAEVEKNGFTNLTKGELIRYRNDFRKQQRQLKQTVANQEYKRFIVEQKAVMFIVSGMLFLLGLNLIWGYEKGAGIAMIFCAILLSLGAYFR